MPGFGSGSPVVVQRKVGKRGQGAERLPGVLAAVQLIAARAQVAQAAEAAQLRRQPRQPVAAQVRSLRRACGSGGRSLQHARSLPPFRSTLAGLNVRRGRGSNHAVLQGTSGPHRCSAQLSICRCPYLWADAWPKGNILTRWGIFYSLVWHVPPPTAPAAPLPLLRPASMRCPFCPTQLRVPAQAADLWLLDASQATSCAVMSILAPDDCWMWLVGDATGRKCVGSFSSLQMGSQVTCMPEARALH